MYVAISPKLSVSEFMSYLKGKSTLMLFDRHPEYRNKWEDRHFWARGYYAEPVLDPEGVKINPQFEMGVDNFVKL